MSKSFSRASHSRLCTGSISHTRRRPIYHAFRYRLFMLYLDLDELELLFARRWFWSINKRNLAQFRRADYLGDESVNLATAVRQRVANELGFEPSGPIRLLAHLRYFGYCMNPVSFYFCRDAADEKTQAIVAEINNTPWDERHSYVLDCRSQAEQQTREFSFAKSFHVSPFMPMDQHYHWRFQENEKQLAIHMKNTDPEGDIFCANLQLRTEPINAFTLARSLLTYPFMTLRIITAIYWQAMRLALKRVSFFPHPMKLKASQEN